MDAMTLRLECLRLASTYEKDPDRIVKAATAYHDFAIGKATATAARKAKTKK